MCTPLSIIHHSASVFFQSIRPQPTVKERDVDFMSTAQLHEFLDLNLLGSSSTMFMWDGTRETFRPAADDPREETVLVVDGLSHFTSSRYELTNYLELFSCAHVFQITSMARRFLDIGTMLRRLEALVAKLRSMYVAPARTDEYIWNRLT